MTLPSITVTIPSGQSASPGFNLGGGVLVGVKNPPDWTTAGLYFEASLDGISYLPLVDRNGNEIGFVVTPETITDLDVGYFMSISYLKLCSGSSSARVNQANDRTFELVVRKL